MQKQLLITFDYELFLGNRSGYVDSCMIDPTNKLIALLKKYSIHGIFFVDTTFLLRLREASFKHEACANDFKKVASQLCHLVAAGHYIFPHIHPHWLDADYLPESNQWRLNNTEKYLFKNISQPDREKVFDGSIAVLKSIIHPKFAEYKINAFRAGGWSIQPFADFIPFFEKHGIVHEFSVLKGFYQFTDAQYFDFSATPEKPVYKFRDDVCTEDPNGPYTQYTISSVTVSPALALMNKIWMKIYTKFTKDHTFHKGEGQPSRVLHGIEPASRKGEDLNTSSRERVAIELLTFPKFASYLNFIDTHSYMHFISHPKMVTNHNLAVFDKFLQKVFEKYAVVTDFHIINPA